MGFLLMNHISSPNLSDHVLVFFIFLPTVGLFSFLSFLLAMQRILSWPEHNVCNPRWEACFTSPDTRTHNNRVIEPTPSFAFSGAFFIVSEFCHRYFQGNLRVCVGAGLGRTRDLLWERGSNRRNPGNVLPSK